MISKAISLRMKFLGHSNISQASIRYILPGVNTTEQDVPLCPSNESIQSNECDRHFEEKSSSLETLVSNLMDSSDVVLEGGIGSPEGKVILKLFENSQQVSFFLVLTILGNYKNV